MANIVIETEASDSEHNQSCIKEKLKASEAIIKTYKLQ